MSVNSRYIQTVNNIKWVYKKKPPKPHIKHTKYLQINSLTLKNKKAHHIPSDLIFLLGEALSISLPPIFHYNLPKS